MDEALGEPIGKVEHFFSKIGVAIINIENGSIKVSDTIRIKGHTTDFEQKIESMQVDHKEVQEAKKGDDIGMKVAEPVRGHDVVYKV
ncbi:MAG: translation elongation factor-like protein [Nanoarchaeota archaeon]|nr:translation elongation factor-like protein [Nanoarchaeota archaeon]